MFDQSHCQNTLGLKYYLFLNVKVQGVMQMLKLKKTQIGWHNMCVKKKNWMNSWAKATRVEVISLFSQHNFPHIHIQLRSWQNSWSVNIKDTHLIWIWTAITILPKSRFEFFSIGSDYKCIEDVKSNKEIYMRGNLSSYHKMLVFDTSSVSTNNWAFVTFLLLSVMIGFKHISKLNHQNCA